MKKRLLSAIFACTLVIAGCSEKKEDNRSRLIDLASYKCYEDGMIFSSGMSPNQVTTYIDFAKMEKSPLCAVPNCTHTTAGCLAVTAGENSILIDSELYFFVKNGHNGGEIIETEDGPQFYMESKLMKASLDSSETELVCEFNGAIPRDDDGCVVIGSELYFIGYDPDPYFDGMGGASWSSGGGYDFLCSINLDTGEYQNYGSICYVEDEYPAADQSATAIISGFYNGKIYITYSFTKEFIVPGPDNENFQPPEFTFYNFEFDTVTKKLGESDYPHALYADEDTYIYSDENTGKLVILDKGENYTIDCEILGSGVGFANGKVFASDSWYDVYDGSVHSFKEMTGYEVKSYYDSCYIFKKNGSFKKLTEEELLALDEE